MASPSTSASPQPSARDGDRIEGRWVHDQGEGWKTDFDLIYTWVCARRPGSRGWMMEASAA